MRADRRYDRVRRRVDPTSVLVVVIQIASSEAAVQPALSTGIRAMTLFATGSIRSTPASPVAQIEPDAATTPIAEPSRKRFTTLFTFGSIRSSSPPVFDVAQAAPYANVESYGVAPTFTAAVRLPVFTETRLIVLELVSSTPERARAEPEPARAVADADPLHDLVRLRVDLQEIRRRVLTDPDEASSSGGRAGRRRRGNSDLREDGGRLCSTRGGGSTDGCRGESDQGHAHAGDSNPVSE